MTESERCLEAMALSIGRQRRQAGCAGEPQPLPLMEDIPVMSGEARHRECLVSVLASGSKGNATFIRCGSTNILIDAGISCRRIEQGLTRYGCSLAQLDAVFITHEHADHVNGLAVLLKKADVPVYTTLETWQHMSRPVQEASGRFVRLTRRVGLKDIQIVPFLISHDAARPVGYTIYYGESKITLATDLGYVSADVEMAAAYSDILVLEANHDEEMLKNGPYPYALQNRILSRRGHLSNKAAAEFLSRIPTKGKMGVLLAHRSEKNNTPALTLHTVRSILSRKGIVVGQDMVLRLACQRGHVRYHEGGHA